MFLAICPCCEIRSTERILSHVYSIQSTVTTFTSWQYFKNGKYYKNKCYFPLPTYCLGWYVFWWTLFRNDFLLRQHSSNSSPEQKKGRSLHSFSNWQHFTFEWFAPGYLTQIQSKQESPAWTQEAYRSPRSKYTLCCSGRGYPTAREGGTPLEVVPPHLGR